MISRTIISERITGYRTIAGTNWPITDLVEREKFKNIVRWIVTYGLCNGFPVGAKVFKTKKEAMEYFAEIGKKTIRKYIYAPNTKEFTDIIIALGEKHSLSSFYNIEPAINGKIEWVIEGEEKNINSFLNDMEGKL